MYKHDPHEEISSYVKHKRLSMNMTFAIPLLFFVVIGLLGIIQLSKKRIPGTTKQGLSSSLLSKGDAYEIKPFLTNRERSFFKKLVDRTHQKYSVLAQVRVADLIKPNKSYPAKSKEYLALFRQISQWHVDFLLVNQEDFSDVVAIELDDSSHARADRVKRDLILNEAMKQAGVRLIRVVKFEQLAVLLENTAYFNDGLKVQPSESITN